MEGAYIWDCRGLFGLTVTSNQAIFYNHRQLGNVAWELHANDVTRRIRLDLYPPSPYSPDPFRAEFGIGLTSAITQDDNANELKLTVPRPDGTILQVVLSLVHADYRKLAAALEGYGMIEFLQFSNGQWIGGTLEVEAGDAMPVPLSAPISVNHVAPSGLRFSEDEAHESSSND